MARDLEMRRRVQRLIAGEFRPDDVRPLFLWLRERSYGIGSIREIGDFVAHSDTREKGPITDDARDYFKYLALRLPNKDRKVDPANLPSDFARTLRSRLR